jgi:arabinose-5-phosphate isomerase
MASTGTPSITLHPVDALHGDMGRIRSGDVLVILSNSGSSREVLELSHAVKGLEITLIAITGNHQSTLAQMSDVILNLGRMKEACPMGVAPSTSTTAMLAIGDALTLTVSQAKGFSLESFRRNHPAGSLGRELRPVIAEMREFDDSAVVKATASILDALTQIANKRCGAAFVLDDDRKLVGIFTSGDLTRMISKSPALLSTSIGEHMVTKPVCVHPQVRVRKALEMLKSFHINNLAVTDDDGRFLGHLDIQDIL